MHVPAQCVFAGPCKYGRLRSSFPRLLSILHFGIFETQSLIVPEACHLVRLPGQQVPGVQRSPSSSAEVTDRY